MLKIGWAGRDITPQRPALLQGQMYKRLATQALDPLTVTALAIEGGKPADGAILIACDLAMISDDLQAAVRRRISRRLRGLTKDKVFLSATHTHTSLVMEETWYGPTGPDIMSARACTDWVADQAADAAVEAWKQRAAHGTARAFGHAVVGHNRRAVYRDGSAKMYGSTRTPEFTSIEGYEDHSLDLFFTWNAQGRLDGVVLNIPCPSQVDEHLGQFSADFWHEIREELRRRLGRPLQVLTLCGAAGDQSPHFLLYRREEEEMRQRRGVSERQEIAMRVADAVERALLCTVPENDAPAFAHEVRKTTLTPRGVSKAERDGAEAERARYLAAKPDGWWPQLLQRGVDVYDGKVPPPPRFPVELHAVRVGQLALVTNPFELYVDYGLQIKARSPAAQTVVTQLAAGTGLYLPTERAVRGGHYGAIPAVCCVGPEGGRELVDETLALLAKLFP